MTEKRISIGFLFDKEPKNEQQERLTMATDLLIKHNAEFEITESTRNDGVTQFEIHATLDDAVVQLHHGFDSVLNKAWPEGCGAGWVLDAAE